MYFADDCMIMFRVREFWRTDSRTFKNHAWEPSYKRDTPRGGLPIIVQDKSQMVDKSSGLFADWIFHHRRSV